MPICCFAAGNPASEIAIDPSGNPVEPQKLQDVRADLERLMDSPHWDDGSYAPILIRLGWHSSGTYKASDGTGGSNGATMRHSVEANDPENAGLAEARKYLEAVKNRHPWISYADLWILAAYVAIEHTGGPRIEFTGGRVDAPASKAIAPGRLPEAEHGVDQGVMKTDDEGRIEGWEKTAEHIREVFGRMGFDDKEMVALITGGHVYGRCHPDSSGYAGAWVENPTFFSNEYAADMIGDKWMLVTHDTKMPDGGEVPEEVRPKPGKRQYIDLTKYEGEEGPGAEVVAPDATTFPPGQYECVSQWVNCREKPDTDSPIIGRFTQGQTLSLVSVKIFGTAVRGLAERGGWVSIIASGGKTLFERKGDFDFEALKGTYRAVGKDAPTYDSLTSEASDGSQKKGSEFKVEEVLLCKEGPLAAALMGKAADTGKWILLFSPTSGQVCEKVVAGYNDEPRRAIKGQSGHQMMLITDMVLLWDSEFKKHLEVYAEDAEALKSDFGAAFKKLTELGCPWAQK